MIIAKVLEQKKNVPVSIEMVERLHLHVTETTMVLLEFVNKDTSETGYAVGYWDGDPKGGKEMYVVSPGRGPTPEELVAFADARVRSGDYIRDILVELTNAGGFAKGAEMLAKHAPAAR